MPALHPIQSPQRSHLFEVEHMLLALLYRALLVERVAVVRLRAKVAHVQLHVGWAQHMIARVRVHQTGSLLRVA